ncbi:hypothetical protein MKW98_011022, partial [Papaver atlanticum]
DYADDATRWILFVLNQARKFVCNAEKRSLILGDNHKLQVAQYNTFYSQLDEHLSQVGIDTTTNKWSETLVLGVVDPHDSLSDPAGVYDV